MRPGPGSEEDESAFTKHRHPLALLPGVVMVKAGRPKGLILRFTVPLRHLLLKIINNVMDIPKFSPQYQLTCKILGLLLHTINNGPPTSF